MAKYHLTYRAIDDLTAIWKYTSKNWSEKQADYYYQTLIDNCQRISENPSAGKNYDTIIKGLMGLKVNRHIVFYRKIDEQTVEIIRFLHVTMDLKEKLSE